ncbi:MAG: shikimate kinase [Pseudomonadota bacterium]
MSFIYSIFLQITPFTTNGENKRALAVLSYTLKKTVALVGMMGSGKTAVGGTLAKILGASFIDSDEEIVAAASMTIPEIFERDGEAFFRDRETEVLGRLMTGDPAILSTGGGAFLAERNRDLIRAAGVAVWLKADLDLLWSRVRHKNTRPLLRTADPRATLAEIYNARTPIYALADVVVEARASYAVSDMAEAVLAALKTHGGILEEGAEYANGTR